MYTAKNDYRAYCAMVESGDTLEHHGILGMKWGVRRYQKYDGSLTQRGVKRYKTAESIYEKKKEAYKTAKSIPDVSKVEKRKAKEAYHKSKTDLKKTYKELKKDKMADKGKSLYNKGKTITGNSRVVKNTATAAALGVAIGSVLAENGRAKEAKYAYAASAGATVIGGILSSKHHVQDKKLRAYYTHTSTRRSKELDKKAKVMSKDEKTYDDLEKYWDINWETGEMTRKKKK